MSSSFDARAGSVNERSKALAVFYRAISPVSRVSPSTLDIYFNSNHQGKCIPGHAIYGYCRPPTTDRWGPALINSDSRLTSSSSISPLRLSW
jgi:hypothetical protein